jgi:hypothetical protein
MAAPAEIMNDPPMRIATLFVLCLCLAGCMTAGDQPDPEAAAAPAVVQAPAPPPASVVAGPPVVRAPAGPGGGARGGASTAAARGGGEPVEARADPLTQARVDCWMKVESQKGLRAIDQRSAFVDKCVAEQMKSKPSP